MIDTAALRSKIIDLAIQGKLTEQLPTDGNAEDLYQQIQAEKAQLIKDKKIKKEKPLPEITADEIPFEIPANWKWVRLRDIVQIINGDRGKNYPAKSTLSHEGIPFISALNLNGDGITEDDRLLCLTDEQYNRLGSGKLERNDIVICIRGSIGKHGRYPYDKGAIASSLVICRPYIYLDEIGCFIMKWLKSYLFVNEIGKYDGGSAQPNLAADNLKKFLVPLPTLSEQKRIVAKLDEVLTEIKIIDELQSQYASNVDVLKSKIIDAGIRGQLTEQLPEDGTAEELYQTIQTEKAQLIKDKKIKKEKPLPEITADEIPFEIPDNWKWVRLRDVCRKIVDGDHNPPAGIKQPTDYMMLSARNINDDKIIDIENVRYLTKEVFEEENKRTNLEIGDVLLTIVATLGRSCVYREQYNVCFQRSVCVITTLLDSDFLKRVFDAGFIQKLMVEGATGAAQPGFYLNKVEKMCIPVPPLSEQKRIVAKINDVFGALDERDRL